MQGGSNVKRITVITLFAILLGMALLPFLGFGPADAAPVGSVTAQTGNEVQSACSATITETASPDTLRLCETSSVTVTAAMTCPAQLPVHLVIVIDRSKSMADTANPVSSRILNDVKRAGRSMIDALDWSIPGTMVGVVSHGFRITTQADLTETKSRAIGGVNAVRYDPGDIGEDPAKAIARAQQMLEQEREGSSPLEVIVLFGDGCDPTVQGCETASRRAAAVADGAGITVMPVCYPESERSDCADYRSLASEPRYYFEGGNRVPRAVEQIESSGRGISIEAVALVEQLGSSIAYKPESGAPVPQVDGAELSFPFGAIAPGTSLTATYEISVTSVGVLPIRTGQSALTLVDSLDRQSPEIPIPVRPITVTGPCVEETPTPTATTPPSSTPTDAATAAPTRTPTPEPSPTDEATATPDAATATPSPMTLFVPVTLRDACKPAEVHTNVVLAIDASTSMDESAGEATKLEAAKDAARTFVSLLQLGRDFAGVVSFNADARVLAPLTDDADALTASIGGIATAPGTRIDLAIDAAADVMRAGLPEVDPGNNQVLVLLTDGLPDEGTAASAMDAANRAKADGMVLYAIGLGVDVDGELLRAIASSDDTYLEAPSAADLEDIYREIAGRLPCPGGAFWPVR